MAVHTKAGEPTAARPGLRVWTPADEIEDEKETGGGGELGADSTLSELFERAFEPLWIRGQGLDRKTSQIYRDALAWWRKLTGDPPLRSIDEWTTSSFVAELLRQPGRKRSTISVATVRKHCASIDSLLAFAGPRTRDRKGMKNRDLVKLSPRCDKPRPDFAPPDGDFTLAEVQAMFAAANVMRSPQVKGVEPAAWWRALLTVAVHTGLRIGQLMRIEYSDVSPPWLQVRSSCSKGRRGKRQYLSAAALEQIEAIRTNRKRIFEFPNWERNPRWAQELLKRLAKAAGIPESRRFGFHGFRKCHASLVASQETDGSLGMMAARMSLGHSTMATTLDHYVNGKVQESFAAAAIDKLPSPKPTRKADTRQLSLGFEE